MKRTEKNCQFCSNHPPVIHIFNNGFTIIEIIVALSILMSLVLAGVPGFRSVIETNRVASITNELSAGLQAARSEAILRSTQVSICTSANTETENPTCSNSASWQDGWIIFTDAGVQGEVDDEDTVLRIGQPIANNTEITPPENLHYISFLQLGETSIDGDSPDDELEFTLTAGSQTRKLEINANGRVQLKRNDS